MSSDDPALAGVTAATENLNEDKECDKAPESSETKDAGKKRENYLDWDEYFMTIALVSAQRSKDPHTQVGACIVNQNQRIVGVGYNGLPDGISDDDKYLDVWNKVGKHKFVLHAECNAILNKMSMDLKDCTLYTTLYPCNNCAKIIIQSGIKKVIYAERKDVDKEGFEASPDMFRTTKVEAIKYADLVCHRNTETPRPAHLHVDLQKPSATLDPKD